MVTVVCESEKLTIPTWVCDLVSFRRWADEDNFPEKGQIHWLNGEVWVDLSKEQIFTHAEVKSEVACILATLAKNQRLGYYWVAGPLVSNLEADFVVKPDGISITYASLKSNRVRFLDGAEGPNEIEGSPDMILEVVSRGSVNKDTVVLREAYWKAGVKEYWLVDARQAPLSFELFRQSEQGYVPTRKQKGWLRSQVFGKSFRLSQSLDALNKPAFTLEVR